MNRREKQEWSQIEANLARDEDWFQGVQHLGRSVGTKRDEAWVGFFASSALGVLFLGSMLLIAFRFGATGYHSPGGVLGVVIGVLSSPLFLIGLFVGVIWCLSAAEDWWALAHGRRSNLDHRNWEDEA